MAEYYCMDCAGKHGWQGTLPTTDVTGSGYQAAKFVKHTAPTRLYNVNSIFDDPTAVENLMINTAASGSLEIDDAGRQNIVWVADKQVGILLVSGQPTVALDAVKLVLQHDSLKVHSYPTASTGIRVEVCQDCGGDAYR